MFQTTNQLTYLHEISTASVKLRQPFFGPGSMVLIYGWYQNGTSDQMAKRKSNMDL
jgi:hypothetical protein